MLAGVVRQGGGARHTRSISGCDSTPSPTDAPWRLIQGTGVPTMKVINEGMIHNKSGWNPTPLLRPIALPVGKVLEAPAPAAYLQQPPDSVHLTTIDDPGRRRGLGGGGQSAANNWFDLGDMKGGVNTSHGSRQQESNSRGVDYLSNRKRSHKPGC